MDGISKSANFSRTHSTIDARMAGIASSLFMERPVTLADESDLSASRDARTITLARGDTPAIELAGAGGKLTYSDPIAESSLAALVAMTYAGQGPVAADPASLSVIALADRLARTDIPVLINGPTGTGKEVLSNFIHRRSERAEKPFIAVNCAAIPETMLEAMLFGHEKGSFTSANAAGEGFFRAADGGTLLLDEIAEMPLSLQAKLLRALQEGEVVPIGATRPIKVDVRIIACANRDLPQEVAEGRFRADLYYRLNVFPIEMLPLRERRADIAPLAFAMVLRHVAKGDAVPWISDAALAMLGDYAWPGNVRELENVIRRALLLSQGRGEIGTEHIVFDMTARAVETPAATQPAEEAKGPAKLSKIVQISEARAIMEALDSVGGHRANAARALGISERTLRYRLASFREAGIAVGAGR
ncbi:MAG: sigma 54-interacting transcriptional regulator [Qipengyuania citrea]|jgi:two-component system response regulator FlrC|uniref:sigma-54 interaction domain-containing protein n=1 Tax=Erythrobacteraceae TaxID=335929 RepID=UPI0007BA23C7|nr:MULTISPECIES: sigma 54-interacting transcriptional regulator [unclassified Erythrobacter]MAG06899.1 sigma-54-dependent Fis family transcriptional regulator [Sphingomonadaceae bacterium]MCZ4264889.1 sigma 54-interacting transcriptional regulator [Erythrobacter sp. G21629-S1]HAN88098.1 sigma-54-dependent Fis family transcriptional regulator [Erythrobacter sp.]KZX88153.1 sigma-54-dependent Fis family transcriptional regulator [Erythrobacter sp. HI0019]KZY02559.1 sigma-54-dependent Fis family t|tara:strand:- start:2602 stop:3855 length:1254 start_codon:yes stop_codon:yes gene_type:complete